MIMDRVSEFRLGAFFRNTALQEARETKITEVAGGNR